MGFFARVRLNKLELIPAGLRHSFNPAYHFLHPHVSVSLDPLESWGDYQRKEDGQTGRLFLPASPPVQGEEGHSGTPELLSPGRLTTQWLCFLTQELGHSV